MYLAHGRLLVDERIRLRAQHVLIQVRQTRHLSDIDVVDAVEILIASASAKAVQQSMLDAARLAHNIHRPSSRLSKKKKT